MTTESQIDPESLVARMMAELQANPAARELFLRSALTQEFLGLPARMEAVENRLAGVEDRLANLEKTVAELVEAVKQLVIEVGHLKGVALETRLHRRVRSRVSQALGLRRARIMQSQLLEPLPELLERMDTALADGLITDDQDSPLEATDVILRAERKNDGSAIWVAIEASSSINERDIQRARESADILSIIFQQPTEAAVVGHRIGVLDEKRADTAQVHVLLVDPVL